LPEEVDVGFGLVKRGNEPAQRTVDTGYSERFAEARRVLFEAVNIPLLHRWRRPAMTVRAVRREDLDAMAGLFNRANGERLFASHVDGDWLEREMAKPGLDRQRWYVVERHGRLVGMAAAWDQHAFHRTRVLRYASVGVALRAVYEAGRRVLRNAAPLPVEGSSFRSITLSRVAIENADPAVLRALLAAIARDHVGRGYHMMHVGFAGDDPLHAATRGMVCQRFRSQVIVMVRRDRPECSGWYEGNPYVDLAMI
ncbi:MAG: hypothetical protein ACOC1F_10040, partial [Myxococcota bacterium]